MKSGNNQTKCIISFSFRGQCQVVVFLLENKFLERKERKYNYVDDKESSKVKKSQECSTAAQSLNKSEMAIPSK